MRKIKEVIQQFEHIKETYPNTLIEYIIFAFWSFLGTLILPIFLKVSIDALEEYTRVFPVGHNWKVLCKYINVTALFAQKYLWLICSLAIAIYWFRNNIKIFNYSFSLLLSNAVHLQLNHRYIQCPRCGWEMEKKFFSEKERQVVDYQKKEYYEYERHGDQYYQVIKTEEVPIYATWKNERKYAVCTNPYCGFRIQKPHGQDIAHHKFSSMPCRVKDTLLYMVNTQANERKHSGDVFSYWGGISLAAYLVLIGLIFSFCDIKGYECATFLVDKEQFGLYLRSLYLPISVTLAVCMCLQVLIHSIYKKTKANPT